jgi:hypothetical protein
MPRCGSGRVTCTVTSRVGWLSCARRVRGALDFLMPAAVSSTHWPSQEIAGIDSARETGPVLAHAALGYADGPYGQALNELVAGQSSLAALELPLGAWALP